MPKLTTLAVANYTAKTSRREIPDSGTNLYLVIQPKPRGTKSWAMRFRRPDGKPAKFTLGRVDFSEREPNDEPELGGALTLLQARALASRIDRERARGVDVVEHYMARRARAAAAAETRAANTFGATAREFFVDHRTRHGDRPRRWRGDARLLGLRWPREGDPAVATPEVIPGSLVATWADKPVAEIDSHDIHAVVDDARRNGIPGLPRHNKGVSAARGRKMHAALSVLFRWALQQRRVTTNPTIGVWHPGAPPARERVLSTAELRDFWRATDAVSPAYGAVFKILLLTGARLNEVTGMHRAELSEDGIWTIPGERTKNHRPHVLALPPLARKIIAAVPKLSEHVFSATGKGPLTGFSRAKADLDAKMGDPTPWRLHDLRRTFVTGLVELGVAPHVVELIVNHVSGTRGGVAGVYNRAELTEERRVALQRWAAHVEGLVTDKPANVTTLRRRGKS